MNLKTEDNNTYTNNNMNENGNIEDEFGKYDDLYNQSYTNEVEDTPYVSVVKEPEKKSLKDKLLIGLGLIMFIGIAGWCLFSGAKALFFAPVHSMEEAFTSLVEGDVYEGTITCISPEVGELKHTINFIPAGTEHFYLMVSEDGTSVVPIRASKKWDTLYASTDWLEVSLQERGIVREMDYKVKSELMSDIAAAFTAEGIKVEQTYYLDLNANKMGTLQIFAGIAILVCIVYFGFVANRIKNDNGTFSTVVGGIMLVIGFVAAGLIIYLLNMVGL